MQQQLACARSGSRRVMALMVLRVLNRKWGLICA